MQGPAKMLVVELSSIFIYPSVDYVKDKIITMAKTGRSSIVTNTILLLYVHYLPHSSFRRSCYIFQVARYSTFLQNLCMLLWTLTGQGARVASINSFNLYMSSEIHRNSPLYASHKHSSPFHDSCDDCVVEMPKGIVMDYSFVADIDTTTVQVCTLSLL